jgi:hypothetical protein
VCVCVCVCVSVCVFLLLTGFSIPVGNCLPAFCFASVGEQAFCSHAIEAERLGCGIWLMSIFLAD